MVKEREIIGPLELLPKDWKSRILELMGEGASKEEVMADLGLNKRSYYGLIKSEKEFSDAISDGEVLSEAWWRRLGREKAVYHPKGDRLDPQIYRLNMQNRFGWVGDSQKVDHSGNVDSTYRVIISREELAKMPDEELNRRLAEIKEGGSLRLLAEGRK